ncbi:MAG: UDP-glucose/GDP-mannose dehydrogenase family protein [Termitinemataceae bacterium]|nr:MAG: UDP-glucose/GDP-mannose dehydrogenase family protein [Termitinemataceae bacterium]
MVNITVIGTGYVGLVSGACLADFGNSVICVDTDTDKIAALNRGVIPIYENGLEEIVSKNRTSGNLTFSTDMAQSIMKSDAVFIAVGTPPKADGSADLRFVEQVASDIGRCIEKYTLVVDKSTVPVGVGKQVFSWIKEQLVKRNKNIEFDVVSNPEFLREGTAVYDFLHPDRVVVGVKSEHAKNLMREVYRPLYLNDTPYIETDVESAEMIKYASNAFLAVKIAYINEIANLCDKVGANVHSVALGMGKDKRIGASFLQAGPGYGGSCFPKDTQALAVLGNTHDSPVSIVETTIESNKRQKQKMLEKIKTGIGQIENKKIAVLGLAFKNNTNDIRESPALDICELLIAQGAHLRVFDPAAMEESAKRLCGKEAGEGAPCAQVYFAADEYDCLENSCALIILTEWNQFGNLDLKRVKAHLASPCFFDLRNMYERSEVESYGLHYFGVGR